MAKSEETSQEPEAWRDLLPLASRIVSAHVSHNAVTLSELPALLEQVHRTLAGLSTGEAPVERPQPAVPIKRSVTPDYIVCLEDGRRLKMLKRHLMTAYDMTPEQYRERWGLPSDYPMVAPNYAQKRRTLAKSIGLGLRPGRGRRAGSSA